MYHVLINNTTSGAKTREPKDKQFCNAAYVHDIHICDAKIPRNIIKMSNNIETTALHNMGAHLGYKN